MTPLWIFAGWLLLVFFSDVAGREPLAKTNAATPEKPKPSAPGNPASWSARRRRRYLGKAPFGVRWLTDLP